MRTVPRSLNQYVEHIKKTKVYKQKNLIMSVLSISTEKKDILAFYNYIYKDAKNLLKSKERGI
ncbi:hypothetical protein GCM10020331_034400 [Ectobacillus funiculus]